MLFTIRNVSGDDHQIQVSLSGSLSPVWMHCLNYLVSLTPYLAEALDDAIKLISPHRHESILQLRFS